MKTKIIITAFSALCALCLLVNLISPSKSYETARITPLKVATVVPLPYTVEEMKAFYDVHVRTLNVAAFPEVQEHYHALVLEIRQRYQSEIKLSLVTNYARVGQDVNGGSFRNTNGVPTIEVYIPAIMDLFKFQKSRGASDEDFKSLVVVNVMHELEHLAGGWIPQTGFEKEPYEKRMNDEKQAWAKTCEHTLVPLVEKKRGGQILLDTYPYYTWWIAAGRDVNSPKWHDSIWKFYESTR